MRQFAALALAALALSTGLSTAAFADENGIFFEGKANLTELTVTKEDGSKHTYQVSPKIAANMKLGYKQRSLGFGSRSRCSPFIGMIAEDLRIEVVITKAVTREGMDPKTYRDIEIPVEGQTGPATFIVPAGSYAYGVCGGKNSNELTELGIRPRDGTFVIVEKTPVRVN